MILPPLNTLQAFEAAARHSSFSRAGEELHITHAAISGQIKRLEEWLGRKLFVRSGRGVLLTPAGEELRIAVETGLMTISKAGQGLRRRSDQKTLTVASVPSVATRWLIPALPDFARLRPDIAIYLSYSTGSEEFNAERHDILINNLENPPRDTQSAKLFSRVNKPVASPMYLERTAIAENLDGIHLLHDEAVSHWDGWFEKAGYRPKGLTHGPIYQDFNLLATAVIAGHGVALCPVDVFRREIAKGDLVVLSQTAISEEQGYYIASARQPPRAVTAFMRWFVDVCK